MTRISFVGKILDGEDDLYGEKKFGAGCNTEDELEIGVIMGRRCLLCYLPSLLFVSSRGWDGLRWREGWAVEGFICGKEKWKGALLCDGNLK